MEKFWACTLGEQIAILSAPVVFLGVTFGIVAHVLFPNFGHNPIADAPAAPAPTAEVIYVPGETITVVPTPEKKHVEQARVTTPPTPKALPATTAAASPEVTVSSSQPAPSTIPTQASSLPPTSEESLPASTSVVVVPSSTEASPSN